MSLDSGEVNIITDLPSTSQTEGKVEDQDQHLVTSSSQDGEDVPPPLPSPPPPPPPAPRRSLPGGLWTAPVSGQAGDTLSQQVKKSVK